MINENCIFCNIADKKIKANIIYEDRDILAFLDVNPVTKGHTLIIPKKHYHDTFDLPDELLAKINLTAKSLGNKYKKILGNQGANFVNASGTEAQQSVLHYHLHLVPRYADENLNLWFHEEANQTTQRELSDLKDEITLKLNY